MVTSNPARLLHLEQRMGSIRVGKDADLVLWSDHPLSIYAMAETTWVEGIPYFDRTEDQAMREMIASERARSYRRYHSRRIRGQRLTGERPCKRFYSAASSCFWP